MTTTVTIYEWKLNVTVYTIADVVASGSIWDDCLDAIQTTGYRSVNYPNNCSNIRAPYKWSSPNTNLQAQALVKYSEGVKQSPHLHSGPGKDHRAAVGCILNPANATAGQTYTTMSIYIGEFS